MSNSENQSSNVIVKNDTDNETYQEPSLPVCGKQQYTFLPTQFPHMLEAAEKQEAKFWVVHELDFTVDKKHWSGVGTNKSLTKNEKYFIEVVLAFFAGSDGIVLENLLSRFSEEINIPEVNYFYTFQAHMENIHSRAYSLMIDALIEDKARKHEIFNAIDTIPCVGKKAKWALKWINGKRDGNLDASGSSIMTRLLAFACVEGIFFSGSFCALFWLKKRGLMPGLTHANELISRDEGMHTDFAVDVYKLLHDEFGFRRRTEAEVHELFKDAVVIEKEFILDALSCELVGMNKELMSQYIEYVADRLLTQFSYAKIYNTPNPFQWMVAMSIDGKTNFFEKRVSEYALAGKEEDDAFDFDDDF
jgi:ribonucleoside-diphosphate reductase subunit M2